MSNNVPQKKRGRPATGVAPRLGVRLPPSTLEKIERRAQKAGADKSETVRQLIDETLRSSIWYHEPYARTDGARNVVEFVMGVGKTEFACQVSFEAIELIANRHGSSVNSPDEHLFWGKMFQPELKDLCLEKQILRLPVLITTDDVGAIVRR